MLARESLILVAILPQPRDLEIARLLAWYRIPVKKAPKTLLVDYIAFYQPASFGKTAHAIHWYAAINGHELVTRRELLRDEPNHPRAEEQYYKLQLGGLEKREPPLPSARWRRLSFFYTTGEYFLQARDLTDLLIGSAERELLWQALRERGISAEKSYQTGQALAPELGLEILCALGTLQVYLPQSEVSAPAPTPQTLYLPQRRVREAPTECTAEIAEQIKMLGGALPRPSK